MIYYCDSSAVVKIYLEEAGSVFMKNLCRKAPIGDIIINAIAGPEVLSALHRRFRSGDVTLEIFSQARQDFAEDYIEFFSRYPVSEPIIQLAMHLIEKYPLRGYDSVQLATAVHFQNALRVSNGREIIFIGSDKILNTAAKTEGLTVINPSEQE